MIKDTLWDGMDGWDWMVIIEHKYYNSTFVVNKEWVSWWRGGGQSNSGFKQVYQKKETLQRSQGSLEARSSVLSFAFHQFKLRRAVFFPLQWFWALGTLWLISKLSFFPFISLGTLSKTTLRGCPFPRPFLTLMPLPKNLGRKGVHLPPP